MADICKCNRLHCLIKHKCYRYLAKDSMWQTYSAFEHSKMSQEELDKIEHLKQYCDAFWDIKNENPENYIKIVDIN